MASVVTPLRRAAARIALSKNAASTSKKSNSKSPSTRKPRVQAKKTTIRAPLALASSSTRKRGKNEETSASEQEEEEIERISLSSSESIAISDESDEKAVVNRNKKSKVIKKSGSKTGNKSVKKTKTGRPKKIKTKPIVESESEASEESERNANTRSRSANNVRSVAVDVKPKKKTGRPKSKKPAKITEEPGSPVKKKQGGRPPRAVNHFIGGQKHALLAKKIFTDSRVAVEQRPKAIVIERAVYVPEKIRRRRVPWTEEEISYLQTGVLKHGEGFWSDILNDPEFSFNESRTQIDLKDKWRNLTSYVKYQEHPIRRFVLVDSTHQMIRSDAGNLHVFRNRWPRDAALKVATKDEFYPLDENNERATSAIIHIKELLDQEGKLERPDIVHVYRVTRVLERPKNVKKFEGYAAVWTGRVEKVAEEILVRKEEVLSPEDEQLIEIQRKQELLNQQ